MLDTGEGNFVNLNDFHSLRSLEVHESGLQRPIYRV